MIISFSQNGFSWSLV